MDEGISWNQRFLKVCSCGVIEAATAGFLCSVMGVSRDYILFSNALNAWRLRNAPINHEHNSAIKNRRKVKVAIELEQFSW